MKQVKRVALALDIGGTNFRVGLIDHRGRVLHRHSQPIRVDRGPEAATQEITKRLLDMRTRAREAEVVGLGIAAPGPVEPDSGVIHNPPNLPGWDGISLRRYWDDRLGLPVWVGNDANLAALGEHLFGVARGVNDFIYITISTGIGGGIISGGKLITGAHGYAAEIGHMTIEPRGPLCNCGNVGCLEAMASGPAIAQAARQELQRGKRSLIRTMVEGDLDRVTAVEVAEAAYQGDRLALRIIEKAATSLAQGIVSLVHLFNPSMIAVGGGVSRGWPLWQKTVDEYVSSRAMEAHRQGLRIVQGSLGDNAGLLGAGALAFRESGSVSKGKS